ncbi:MAG: hypothetical protein AAGF57_02780 [Pseudomonadota bacterium]
MGTRRYAFTAALVAFLSFNTSTYASCQVPGVSAKPVIPNGASASPEAMLAAQEEVAGYVDLIESYLECRANRLPSLIHDGYVRLAEAAAAEYNTELGKFRLRETELAGN